MVDPIFSAGEDKMKGWKQLSRRKIFVSSKVFTYTAAVLHKYIFVIKSKVKLHNVRFKERTPVGSFVRKFPCRKTSRILFNPPSANLT